MPEETKVVAAPTQNTAEDALARARGYLNAFAAEAVKDSGLESEPQAEPEAIAPPDPAPEEEAEPAEGVEGEAPAEEQPEEAPSEEVEAEPEIPGVTPEVQESINKRIGKEVAKTKAEREQREALETRLKELEAQIQNAPTAEPKVVSTSMPLAEVVDLGKLEKLKADQKGLRNQVIDLLDSVEDEPQRVERELRASGVILKDESGEEDFSVARMRRTLKTIDRNVRKTLEEQIPAREEFLKTESQLKAQVFEQVPELKNPSSSRARIMHQVLQDFPEVKLNPKWPLFVAGQVLFIEGLQKSQAVKAGKPAAKAASTPSAAPKIPARPKSSPAPLRKDDAESQSLHKAMMSGDKEARIKLLQKMVG
jgi:hypothetical protein